MISERVPKTDDEALNLLQATYQGLVCSNLQGIFRIKRAQGLSVLDALEYVLLAYLHPKKHEADLPARKPESGEGPARCKT